MSVGTSLYRFQINLSDIDRGHYDQLDFRMAMHPSETFNFLITRMFAYVLNYQEGLVFSAAGLGEPDDPCLSMPDPRGGTALWIEVGSPSARRLHKAAKASTHVKVYTYKNPQALVKEIISEKVYNLDRIEIFSIPLEFLERLEHAMEKDNTWDIIHNEGSLTVNIGDHSEAGELIRHEIPGVS
ncbi:MAG: YaeQ family protein [Bdellovibrionota bacterium]